MGTYQYFVLCNTAQCHAHAYGDMVSWQCNVHLYQWTMVLLQQNPLCLTQCFVLQVIAVVTEQLLDVVDSLHGGTAGLGHSFVT